MELIRLISSRSVQLLVLVELEEILKHGEIRVVQCRCVCDDDDDDGGRLTC